MMTDRKKFRTVIASLPSREKCVCEIYYNHTQWAEISNKEGKIVIQFYPPPLNDFWEFSLDAALEVLNNAKNQFFGS